MYIRLGTVDGQTHTSRYVSDEELDEAIRDTGGRVGTGEWSDLRVESKGELIELANMLFRRDTSLKWQTASIEISYNAGQKPVTRYFNVEHVVWWEVMP